MKAGDLVTPVVRLERELAAGGMGSVWIAEHLTLRTSVVVKLIALDLKTSEEYLARFAREATIVARLRSPHVVHVLDHGVSNGTPFIVMEHLEGEDLAARLRREQNLPAADVVAIVTQLARALDRAHEHGVVHRDLKPANVFLCRSAGDIFVKLLDFGIAKSRASDADMNDPTTRTGTVLGTPNYMSPEQLTGDKAIDARSDLWALGALTFEMLTGRRPYEAETFGEHVLKVHTAAVPRITDLAALPPAVDAWFARACAKRPEDRYPSAPVLASELQRALGHAASAHVRPALVEAARPLATESTRIAHTLAPSPQGVRSVLAVAAVAALLGLGAIGYGARRMMRSPAPPPATTGAPLPVASAAAPPAEAAVAPSATTAPSASSTAPSASTTATARPVHRKTAPPKARPSAPPAREDDIE